jgi:tyrosyl-tRNA synthetase
MKQWYTLLTDRPIAEIETLADPEKTHPMVAKKTLARDIVTFYYGADAAVAAQANFEKQFGDKKDPDNIPEVTLPAGEIGLLQLLVKVGFCKVTTRRAESRRGGGERGPDRTR